MYSIYRQAIHFEAGAPTTTTNNYTMGPHFKISGSELYDSQDAGSVTKSVHNLVFTQDEYEETRPSLKYPEFLLHISPEEVETYENVANPDHV